MSKADEDVGWTKKSVLKNGSITNLEVANDLGIWFSSHQSREHLTDGTRTIGFCAVTPHLLLFCLCVNLLLKTKLLAAYCHCRPHLAPRDLPLFSKLKMLLKWRQFNVIVTTVAKSRYAFCWVLNVALFKATWSLGSLCTVPWRPVWRGRHWTEGRYCPCGETDLVQKVFNFTTYVIFMCLGNKHENKRFCSKWQKTFFTYFVSVVPQLSEFSPWTSCCVCISCRVIITHLQHNCLSCLT
jgi:hypothetical protein